MRFYLFLFLACLSLTALACPTQILVIRHGEKIPNTINLSPKGKQRAQALVKLFTQAQSQFNKPTFVMAVADKSFRPGETCLPTAQALGVKLNLSFTLAQEANGQLSQFLLNKIGTGLICLEHDRIPSMVKHITDNQLDLGKWHKEVFDRIIVLNFKEVNGQCIYTDYQDLPENVLPSDYKTKSCCTNG